MAAGDLLVFNVLLNHAPLLNTDFGERFVCYPYYGPMLDTTTLKSDPLCGESILPNNPRQVCVHSLFITL